MKAPININSNKIYYGFTSKTQYPYHLKMETNLSQPQYSWESIARYVRETSGESDAGLNN